MADKTIDALVVGAGFAGIYQLYCLRKLGLNVKCIDKAGGVGGTWYWNLYPGAMSDTESFLYRFSWDKDDLRTYPWANHYLYQPEILKYLNHVADRHDLRPLIQLNTEMKTAEWVEEHRVWRVVCGTGEVITTRYVVCALGLLTEPNYPKIPGLKDFHGKLVHTAAWPSDLDLSDKTVGIIGNGSTGVQVMTAIAPVVKRLVSFQRNPQYSVPSGQKPVTKEHREWINTNYDTIYDGVWNSSTGFGVPEVTTPVMSVSDEERRRIFQSLWDQGNGFRFMFSGFGDITTNKEANWEACKFIHSKIDEIVKDPVKADALKPTEFYARRPLCDTGYYQIFNRDNVDIVSLRKTPITSIVPRGIATADGTVHDLDVLICATGFHVFEGSYVRVAIKGRNGETLKEHWKDGACSFSGVAMSGFPNLFTPAGPQGPFSNFPSAVETEVEFITACIEHAEANYKSRISGTRTIPQAPVIEVKPEAEQAWGELCVKLCEGSIFHTAKSSWIFGTNVEGHQPGVKFYFGGLKSYRAGNAAETKKGFPSFMVN